MEKTPDFYLYSTYRIMSSRTDLGKILMSFYVGQNPKVPKIVPKKPLTLL